ncbi:hypothetical protein AB6A40_009973 [Gnathostoma spinigerum]|uniref:Uncharacterized protein n=1 Tax=Gnathostoma spinigerum TaxID=75299 RepID=A0ABD6ETG0_9BILA
MGQADNPPAPDFMGYPCEDVVRRLEALFDSETVDDEDSGKADDIKEESVSAVAVILESMMTHNIDYQKRIAGELRFHRSGEYASDDISNRPKPFFVYRTQPVIAPESTRDSDDDLCVFFYISLLILTESRTCLGLLDIQSLP